MVVDSQKFKTHFISSKIPNISTVHRDEQATGCKKLRDLHATRLGGISNIKVKDGFGTDLEST